jgi:hypothetical protein
MTVQNTVHVLSINVYKLSKFWSSFLNTLHYQKSHWTVTIPGKIRCVLLQHDRPKHCTCPPNTIIQSCKDIFETSCIAYVNSFAFENYVTEVEKGEEWTHFPPTLPLTATCTIVPSPGFPTTAPSFYLRSRFVIGAKEVGISNARRVGGSDGRHEPTLSVFFSDSVLSFRGYST